MRGYLLLLTVSCFWATARAKFQIINRTLEIDVTRECPDELYRTDYTDSFRVQGQANLTGTNGAWWRQYGSRCQIAFQTLQTHGICIDMAEIDIFSTHVTLEFFTNSFRPEKQYKAHHGHSGLWCTHHNLVTMVMVINTRPSQLQPSFSFRFAVINKTLSDIQRTYHLDSPVDCNMQFLLKEQETVKVRSHRRPFLGPSPPVCHMTFSTESVDEYGQVCVMFETFDLDTDCNTELKIMGVDDEYWQESIKQYGCETKTNAVEEVCSKDKSLTLKMTRKGREDNRGNFDLKVASKWMTKWESSEAKKTELRVMYAAKSLTVLIATLDTLIALAAAFISIASRYPYGRLQVMADIFGKDPVASHYGNEYPVAVAVTSGEADPPPF